MDAEKILCEEMPVIPLFYQPTQVMTKKNLHFNNKHPSGTFDVARALLHKCPEGHL